MSPDQKIDLTHVLRTVLSTGGYRNTIDVMSMEVILKHFEPDNPLRDTQLYYLSIYGTPSPETTWGFSFEGHHLSLNFTFQDAILVSHTPFFMGSNPAKVLKDYEVGIPKGTEPLKKLEGMAFDFLDSLDPELLQDAHISTTAIKDVRGAGEAQPIIEFPIGVLVEDLEKNHKELLIKLIDAHLMRVSRHVANKEWERIHAAGLDKITFGWWGATKPGIGHYYRIQGPTFLVELANTQPDIEGNPANHVHTVWRDREGDFFVPIK